MDDSKKIKNSLQFKLSIWLMASFLLFAAGAGILSFFRSFHEAGELLDEELQQVAELLVHNDVSCQHNMHGAALKDERAIIVRKITDRRNENFFSQILYAMHDGFHTVSSVDGKKWRMFITSDSSGERFLVAQQFFLRNKIAVESMIATLAPFLAFTLIAAIVACLLVRRLFRPIRKMAASIDKRDEQDLSPIYQHHMPSELIPFIESLNRMFSRVTLSMEMQRRFVADAAHELRSPLAALTLQAERLEAVNMPAPARERLNILRTGLNRACALLNQLLTLARAQGHRQEKSESLSLMALFRQVLSDMLPLAEAKNIDLGIASVDDVVIALPPMAAASILKNLVDNAIRYTPEGGCIDLYAGYAHGAPFFSVSDTGPGIPPEEMNRVFDPFYRVLGNTATGSGLGLSIVKTLVESAGGTVSLENLNTGKGTGLRATVSFRERQG